MNVAAASAPQSMRFTGKVAALLKGKSGHVWSIPPGASIYEAIDLMATCGVGALPVVEHSAVVGIISERDYARKVVLQGRNSRDTPVRDIMVSPVITITRDWTVDDCLRVISNQKIRHLPVVEQGRLTGMISIGDLVEWVIQSQERTIQQLESYIRGSYPA